MRLGVLCVETGSETIFEFCRRLLVFDVTVVCLCVHAASHSLTA